VSTNDLDHTLIARFLSRRDEHAFDALYSRHTPRMYGLALRLAGGDEPDAREIVQEAWTRAVSRLDTFRGESRLSSWLCGICANVWREHLRRHRPEVALEAGLNVASTVAGASDAAPGAPRSGVPDFDPIDVRRALEKLAPGYRAVIVLHGIYGHSHAEVAEMLGISEGTSKSQLLRGRQALRRALHETEGEKT
jgi:RNA polymerase sigma-70 factor (ECF subfamily)